MGWGEGWEVQGPRSLSAPGRRLAAASNLGPCTCQPLLPAHPIMHLHCCCGQLMHERLLSLLAGW